MSKRISIILILALSMTSIFPLKTTLEPTKGIGKAMPETENLQLDELTKGLDELLSATLQDDVTEVETANNTDRYAHNLFVLASEEEKSFPLNASIEKIARAQNIALNGSQFLDTQAISNTKLTHQNLQKHGGKEVIITTEDNIKLYCTFLDRKKDKIVIIGPGLTNDKEKMASLAHIYIDYDVVLMSFRGNGSNQTQGTHNPLVKLLEFDSKAGFGVKEEKDVFAVVNYVRNIPSKYYSQIIGHGICYGATIFAKAQGIKEYNNEFLFDKLILDGTWHSINKFKEKILGDPALISNPQKGGAPVALKWLFSKSWFHNNLQKIIELALKIDFNDLYTTDYVSQITIPVLYFYGKNDLTIYRDEFEEIWNATKSKNKIACITSNEHVWNHLKQKELYKLICEIFIECEDTTKVLTLLSDQRELLKHLFQRLVGNAEEMPDENIFKPHKKPKTFMQNVTPGNGTIKTTIALLAVGGLMVGYKQGYLTTDSFAHAVDRVSDFFGECGQYIRDKQWPIELNGYIPKVLPHKKD